MIGDNELQLTSDIPHDQMADVIGIGIPLRNLYVEGTCSF